MRELPRAQKYQVLPFSKSFAHFRQCFATAFSSILGKVWNVVFFYLRENETTVGFNGFKAPPTPIPSSCKGGYQPGVVTALKGLGGSKTAVDALKKIWNKDGEGRNANLLSAKDVNYNFWQSRCPSIHFFSTLQRESLHFYCRFSRYGKLKVGHLFYFCLNGSGWVGRHLTAALNTVLYVGMALHQASIRRVGGGWGSKIHSMFTHPPFPYVNIPLTGAINPPFIPFPPFFPPPRELAWLCHKKLLFSGNKP